MADARPALTETARQTRRKPGDVDASVKPALICFSADGLGFAGHFWTVTNVRINDVAHYHHACKRCGAEKDVPLDAGRSNSWPKSYSASKGQA